MVRRQRLVPLMGPLLICIVGLGIGAVVAKGNWMMLAAPPLVAVTLAHPLAGLSMMSFLMPLELMLTFGSFGTLTKGVGLLTLAVWLLRLWREHRLPRFAGAWGAAVVFSSISLVSMLWAPQLSIASQQTTTLFSLLAYLLILVDAVRERQALHAVVWAFIGGTVVSTVIAFMTSTGGRLALEGDNPNVFGSHSALALLLLPVVLRGAQRALVLTGVFAGIILTIATIMSESRGTWVALAGALVIIAVPQPRKLLIPIVLLAATSFAVLPMVSADELNNVVARITSIVTVDDRLAGRLDIWPVAQTAIADRPLTGVGAGNFPYTWDHYATQTFGIALRRTNNMDAHNSYLTAFAELGLFGFLSFCGILIISASTITRNASGFDRSIALSLIVFTAIRAVTATAYYRKFFWLGIGVALVLAFLARSSPKEGQTIESSGYS